MNKSLDRLCNIIKNISTKIARDAETLSFVIITAKKGQGVSTLLKQSHLTQVQLELEDEARLYYNNQGLILDLSETWMTQSTSLLLQALKQINRASCYLKITGLILCVDIHDLLLSDSELFISRKEAHIKLLDKVCTNLGYKIKCSLLFTQMDSLAGFSEFYQNEHSSELEQALGFSLEDLNQKNKKADLFSALFNHFIELLGQKVIHKMHAARSQIKRTLIREFPLQVATLKKALEYYVFSCNNPRCHLNAIYFISAEQGGLSLDRLNKKIQQEYALSTQDSFVQAGNHKAYFIEGMINSVQMSCASSIDSNAATHKKVYIAAASTCLLALTFLTHNYYHTAALLDDTSKELLAFDALNAQKETANKALYHLVHAAKSTEQIKNTYTLPHLNQLKMSLQLKSEEQVQGAFVPKLIEELEEVINNSSQTPAARYEALKVYLMLGMPQHLNKELVLAWFNQRWKHSAATLAKNNQTLLEDLLKTKHKVYNINLTLVRDARNYLNALPSAYLYYTLAKEYFPKESLNLSVSAFILPTKTVPFYFTKAGFSEMQKELPKISQRLQDENWVLARQDLSLLNKQLVQAYCFEYNTWWQHFMKTARPLSYHSYQEGRQILGDLQKNSSFFTLIKLIQEQTKPDETNETLFNERIASQFTDINLISDSSTKDIQQKLNELQHFIGTLSLINDGGKTAFSITKTRFLVQHAASDPLSALYTQAETLPEPLANWSKQIASDTWVLLIAQTRSYLNAAWKKNVYKDFELKIAHRYPFDSSQDQDIALDDFNQFFAPEGLLNHFSNEYIKPFIDRSTAEWKPKVVNDFVLPLPQNTLNALIRANIITNMFFPEHQDKSSVHFSLQKINLDPVVASLSLHVGSVHLSDNQNSDAPVQFIWPEPNASLRLDSIEGNHYELSEQGIWGIFKLLDKVNVLIDEDDSSSLQILFEVNSNSGRYVLKTDHPINPFTPGILNGFNLTETLV